MSAPIVSARGIINRFTPNGPPALDNIEFTIARPK